MKVEIGFVRKEEVSVVITPVAGITEEQLLEGLTSGEYEIMESEKIVFDTEGNTVGTVSDWEVDDLTHGSFEIL